MNHREKARLQETLAQLSSNDRRRLYKQAAKLRRSAQPERGVSGAGRGVRLQDAMDEEEVSLVLKRSRAPSQSLDDWVLRLLKEEEIGLAEETGEVGPESRTGIVVGVGPGRCAVGCGDVLVECALRTRFVASQQTDLAVGDQVRFSITGDRAGVVEEVMSRKSALSRPDPFHRHIERVIAANIDAAVIVVSVQSPPLHPRLIDRYLIAIERGGAQPMICINKMDLLSTAEGHDELSKLEPYRELGIRVIPCSASDGQGVSTLLEALSGKLCVFVGHSGVGKSSLLNAIHPELGLGTNTLREADGKGRHTTTASHLYALPGSIRVIDTPGIREFGLWKLSLWEVRWYFQEFTEIAAACKYSDCSHIHEPACAVKQAVSRGRISRARYDSYCRIARTL